MLEEDSYHTSPVIDLQEVTDSANVFSKKVSIEPENRHPTMRVDASMDRVEEMNLRNEQELHHMQQN